MNIQKLLPISRKRLPTWMIGGLFVILFSILLGGTFLLGRHFLADATGVYQATGLLGQYDDTHVHAPVLGATPADYVAAFTNNRPPINDRGLAPHTTSTVADVVNHRLFVSDLLNYRVLVFNLDANDKLIDHSADYVLGEPDMFTRSFSTPATAANTFSAGGGPNGTGAGGLDIDPVRQLLFVADSGKNRVLIFDISSLSNNMNASFVLGQINFTDDASGTTAVTMNHPTDVAYDSTQNRLYVADSGNNRILGFDLSSGISNGMVSDQVIGQADFFSSVDSNNLDGLSQPTGLGIDPGQKLFVAAPNSSGTSLRVFDLVTLPGAGATAAYAIPTGMTYDAAFDTVSKKLYVSSFLFGTGVTVYDFSLPSNNPPVLATLGAAGTTSDTTSDQTKGLYIDPRSGDLYVNDSGNNRVLIYEVGLSGSSLVPNMPATNNVGQLDANDQPIFATKCLNNGCPNAEGFNSLTAVDHSGTFTFASDSKNNRVLIFNGSTIASNVLGQDEFYTRGADTTGTNKGLNLENSLMDTSGVVYDASKKVLYVSDTGNNRIMVYDLSGSITNGMVAIGVIGQSGFSQVAANRGGAVADNTLSRPAGLVLDDTNHKLYVADAGNNRVLKFDLASSVPVSAEDVFGQSDFISSTQDVAHLNTPEDIVIDTTTQRIFIADAGNHRVVSFLTTGTPLSHSFDHVLGQSTFLTQTAGTSSTNLSTPTGIRFDGTERQRLFVADTGNNRIVVYDLTHGITNGMSADSIIGQSDFVTGAGNVSRSDMNTPKGLFYDASANALFIADQTNHRLIAFRFIELTPAPLANGVIGTPYSQTIGTNSFTQGTTTLSLESGTLPPGITLSGMNLVGTPTTVGTYTFILRGIDTMNPDVHYYDLETYTITVTSTPAPQNGICGTSHMVATSSIPTTGLCSLGTASAVAGSGPWTWTCSGVNGGSAVSCNAPVATSSSGGGSSSSGGGGCPWNTTWNGSSCVAVVVSTPTVVPTTASTTATLSCPYFTKYVKYGSSNNDRDEVRKIQDFLVARGFLTGNYTSGTYDLTSYNAVKAFQSSFWSEVINPWNLEGPTGWWYKTSRFKANALVGCPEKEVFLERVDYWWRGLQNTITQVL